MFGQIKLKLRRWFPGIAAFVSLATAQSALSQSWTQTSAPNLYWSGVACSADGARLIAAARFAGQGFGPSGVYVSTNSGANWTLTSAPTEYWGDVASSADGLKLAAIGNQNPSPTPNGGIYFSTNGGSTWMLTSAPLTNWSEITCSSDGTKLVADVWYGQIYFSTNSGLTWMAGDAPFMYWSGLAASADGRKLVATGGDPNSSNIHYVYVSADYGFHWTQASNAPSSLRELASSADGNRLVGIGDRVYNSSDGGQSWTPVGTVTNVEWLAAAASANGTNLTVAGMGTNGTGNFPGPIFASADFGNSWNQKGTTTGFWNALACSADGAKVIAAQGGYAPGYIYIWQQPPILSMAPAGGGLMISWPGSATGFVLQENSDLATTNWVAVTNSVTTVNGQNQILLNHPGGKRFYRLKSS